MKSFLENRSINQINLLATLFSALFILIFAFSIIYIEYIDFQKEIQKIEEEYFLSQKESIVKETNRALRFIEYKHNKYKDSKVHELDELQNEIIEAIEQMRNERDGTGYVFIYDFNGVNIADPILKQNAGKNLINFTDPNGKRVIEELIEVSKKESGGFVEYVWNKPVVNKLAPKISYAKSYKPWGWMIGTGVYLDSVEEVISEITAKHKRKAIIFISVVLIVGFILFIITTLFSKYISNIIKTQIDEFINFFQKASTSYVYIEDKNLYFREFKSITLYANCMVKEIKVKTKALKDLNATLEERVERKTEKLKNKNSELLKAKEFSESLLKRQDKFVKNAIHEINTPLSIILMNIELLSMKGVKNKNLTNIEAASKIIHNIYNDLSYMIKKDLVEYKKTIINFSEFLRERLEFFNEVAIANSLRLKINKCKNLYIEFNETQLQRICDNNISNAIKYSFENSEIEIKLYKENGFIVFEILNSGNEIKEVDKLFDRYYREDGARGGFGIGLNIVKDICDKNGVKIEVYSKDNINRFKYIFKEKDENTTT